MLSPEKGIEDGALFGGTDKCGTMMASVMAGCLNKR